MTSFADNRQRGLPFEQMPARRRVSLSCDSRLEAEAIGTDPIVPIEAPAKVVCSVAVPCDGHVEQLVPCPALANPYTDPLCDSAKTICSSAKTSGLFMALQFVVSALFKPCLRFSILIEKADHIGEQITLGINAVWIGLQVNSRDASGTDY